AGEPVEKLGAVTALVNEWALGTLEPVEAVRKEARTRLADDGWAFRGRAVVSAAHVRLLRDAAVDADVVDAVRASTAKSVLEADQLGRQGMALVLGLACIAALRADAGKAAGDAWMRLSTRRG